MFVLLFKISLLYKNNSNNKLKFVNCDNFETVLIKKKLHLAVNNVRGDNKATNLTFMGPCIVNIFF